MQIVPARRIEVCIGAQALTRRDASVANSKQVSGLVGPTLVALFVSEFPLFQPNLYDARIPPVVYLSGVLTCVADLAVVHAHNVWARNGTLLITLCGWLSLALRLLRMFAAGQYRQPTQGASSKTFLALEGFLLAVALTITVRAYSCSPT
jgi:hypothetical protein